MNPGRVRHTTHLPHTTPIRNQEPDVLAELKVSTIIVAAKILVELVLERA